MYNRKSASERAKYNKNNKVQNQNNLQIGQIVKFMEFWPISGRFHPTLKLIIMESETFNLATDQLGTVLRCPSTTEYLWFFQRQQL